jgi:hypothetical protein
MPFMRNLVTGCMLSAVILFGSHPAAWQHHEVIYYAHPVEADALKLFGTSQ